MRYSEQFMEHIEYAFAAFCRIVLRNAAISAYRDFERKQKHEVSLDYLMSETPFEPFTTDNYFEQYDIPEYFTSRDPERNAVPLHWFFFANHRFAFGIH